jgi:ADP-heptose:LPS heptosyltransferase
MINFFLKYKVNKITSIHPSIDDVRKSRKILFSIFTRYGDTIIDLMVIKEFTTLFPNKIYLIICPKQMTPYVNEFLPSIECIGINKRNLYDMFKMNMLLKKRKFDIGFNPWSNGLDSSFFISYCNRFTFYKDFYKPKSINHYQVVRRYLKLPEKDWKIKPLKLKKSYKKILICPQSTDISRNIPKYHLDILINEYNQLYNYPEITIASMDESFFRAGCSMFKFEKSVNSSKSFLSIMKQSSLIVCSDSGPLHIATALNKDLIAFIRSTQPKYVINSDALVQVKYLNNLNYE